jgi:ABC-type polysaccharide/polyol phosphate transport system ATPase subunit
MSSVIEVENLSKSYLVGHQSGNREKYVALRDVIARGVSDVLRKTRDAIGGRQIVQGDEVEEFWALRDVSFQINPGEVVGVIGRNGAGKSTLLKVLSRITEPTKGRVILRGRTASLLEVGTGFHPELTGRENVFLNGAILGMTKAEIRSKFDEIVAFAEIEKFIDTPVKRYSSGMYVRLAFAVAAHLEPEVLIVDEVLAVGDLAFQAKCLSHLSKMKDKGTTILIVSHNMQVVSDSCARVIMMSQGSILKDGTPEDVIPLYREALLSVPASGAAASDLIEVQKMTLNGRELSVAAFVYPNEEVKLGLRLVASKPVHNLYLNLVISLPNHQQLMHLRSDVHDKNFNLQPGTHQFTIVIPDLPLSAGTYGLYFRLVSVDPRSPLLWDSETVTLTVEGHSGLGGMISAKHSMHHQVDNCKLVGF